MKILLKMLVFTALCLSFWGVNSYSQSTGASDVGETGEAVPKEEAEYPVIDKIQSKPKAFYNFLKSHYYDDGLVFESRNGNYRIRTRVFAQLQFSLTDQNSTGVDKTLFLRRLRLKWDGHFFRPWIKYFVQVSRDNVKLSQLGNSSGVELKDAYVDAVYLKNIFPRIGQFKVPFNREELNSSSVLLLVERSIANTEFAYARDRGLTLYGILGNHVVYGSGIFVGDGTQGTEEGTAIGSNLFATRVQLDFGGTLEYGGGSFPSGGDYELNPDFTKRPIFVLGAAFVAIPDADPEGKTASQGALQKRFAELGITKASVASIAFDASYKLPMFNVEGAYLGRWINPDESGQGTVYDQGLRLQTGVFLVPSRLEIAWRWAYINYDDSTSIEDEIARDNSWELSSGINFYFFRHKNRKLQLSYSYINNEFTGGVPDTDEKVLRLQFQFAF